MTVPAGNRVIAVFGAYGHTARFVVAELGERGWTPVLSGRDAAKLATVAAGAQPVLERRLASIEDPASLDRAIAGAAAVVNCAGPSARPRQRSSRPPCARASITWTSTDSPSSRSGRSTPMPTTLGYGRPAS